MRSAKQRNSSPHAVMVEPSVIEQANQLLHQLPKKQNPPTLRAAIAALQDPIIAALEQGYTYPDVAKVLAAQGIVIPVPSLRRYVAECRRERLQEEGDRATHSPTEIPAEATDIC